MCAADLAEGRGPGRRGAGARVTEHALLVLVVALVVIGLFAAIGAATAGRLDRTCSRLNAGMHAAGADHASVERSTTARGEGGC